MKKRPVSFSLFLAVVLLLPISALAANDMLQFKAGNHILGFLPNKAYLAAMDHALSVEFLGTKGVMPKAESSGTAKESATKATPLNKVLYQNLWEGISLVYESTKDGVTESTYIVVPGADVSKIRLKYNVPVTAQKDGSLKFKFEKGYLTESAPVAWQEINGKRVAVKVAFKVEKGKVGFSVGKYDPSQPLIIDPTYAWHAFYGSCQDTGKSIAIDDSGNVYVTGGSSMTWSGPNNQDPLNPHSGVGNYNIFVLKLNSSGTYQWHTFYGASYVSSINVGNGLVLDASGNVYVVGYSGGEIWNGPGNQAPLSPHSDGGGDIIVLKLDKNGVYQWHTFHGSETSNNWINGITVDGNGNIYVTGWSDDSWGSPKHAHSAGQEDIVVLKLNSSGTYQWHTYYGMTGDNGGTGIALDNSSNIYVVGFSFGTWNGPADQSPLNASSGGNGIVVLKLGNDGTYQWHTFYGSDDSSNGSAIAVDSTGNVYVTGSSFGTWNGPVDQPPLNAYTDHDDIVVLKLDSSGTYQWHTFYGSIANDSGLSIALDRSANVYISGKSYNSWGSPLNPSAGNFDSFILKINSMGAYQWNTFYGSFFDDYGNAIAVDGNGNIYVAGESKASWGSPLHDYSCGLMQYTNLFVLKLAPTTCPDHAVMIGESSSYYTTIHDAYNANAIDKSILMQALEFNENVDLGSNISVTLRGGYECDFLSNPGRTTIHGSLTISAGSATIENVVIQ